MANKVAPLLTVLLLLASVSLVHCDMGIGISGNNHEIDIDAFPFTYSSSFSIHNPSNEDALFSIRATGPYEDVTSWVSIEPAIVSVKAGEYSDISYAIEADEGYGGAYELYLVATCYGNGETDQTPSTPVSYLQTSGTIKLTINVSESAGAMSRGPDHPKPPLVDDKKAGNADTNEITNNVEAYTFDAPLYINIPKEVQCGTTVPIEGGCLYGETPHALHFIIHTPKGDTYERPLETSIEFDDVGEWHVLLALDKQTIVGKQIMVVEGCNDASTMPLILMGAAICVCCMVAYRRKRTSD